MFLSAALRRRRPAPRAAPYVLRPELILEGEGVDSEGLPPVCARNPVALPAPTVPLTDAIARSREEVQTTIAACISGAVADSTKRTYDSTLAAAMPRIERVLGSSNALPLATEDKFLAFFGAEFTALSQKNANLPPPKWPHFRMLRASVEYWHSVHNIPCVMETEWAKRMGVFWKGLKRSCSHTKLDKEALTLDAVLNVMRDGLAAFERVPSDPAAFPTWYPRNKPSIACLRTAACVAIAFFCIRRTSEVTQLRTDDLAGPGSDGVFTITIRRQKNDQEGLGQVATLPPMSAWGKACPTRILRYWLTVRDLLRSTCDREGRMAAGANMDPLRTAPRNPLFTNIRGPRWGLALRTDALNAALRTYFQRLVSPRKGGTQFYLANAAPRAAVQSQGGWRSQATMDAVYARFASANVAQEVLQAAERGAQEQQVASFLQSLAHADDFADLEPGARETVARKWVHNLRQLEPYLTPVRVHPTVPEFRALLEARMTALRLEGAMKKYLLSLCLRYRQELRAYLTRRAEGEV